ncbi:copper chaperone PCu(A)C [Cereibacter sediminicola]|uniref:copper chaperone PCu(A)C n=1 Tax=Cereibacter sediminicola TaxID=2584941 RepID=UPI00119EB23A|nr:copper chaperone PCu(A)C [Cereibacter sediminicola]
MTPFKTLLAAAAVTFALPAFADSNIAVRDAYARVSSPAAKSGAIFMVIENLGTTADRLVSAASEAAARVELHTHLAGEDGIVRMVEVAEGFEVPAHDSHALARGGDHVMLMGLTRPLQEGDEVALTLTFESGARVDLSVPVDPTREDAAAHQMQGMDHAH